MACRRKFRFSSRAARRAFLRRQRETPEETRIRREKLRKASAARRARETPEEKEIRKQEERLKAARRRARRDKRKPEDMSRPTRKKSVRYICREESVQLVCDREEVCNRVVCKYGLRKITKGKKECEDCERDVGVHHVRGRKHQSRDRWRAKCEDAQDESHIRDLV